MEDIASYMLRLGEDARAAARHVSRADTSVKNHALRAIGDVIDADRDALTTANAADLDDARKRGISDALLDRLMLNDARIDAMIEGLGQVAALPDPVGEISDMVSRPSGIQVGHMRVPLGVIGIIYESRPNVTIDAASLCLKSGNAAILRGGSESIHSNTYLAGCIRRGLKVAGLPETAIQLVATADRAAVGELITLQDHVDVIIPRGGKGLIERIMSEARIPVIKHLDGVCHVYIDDDADTAKAISIAVNAKTQRYAVCNAIETLLVSRAVARKVLPALAEEYATAGVELRGCEETCSIVPAANAASEADWGEEYLAPVLAVRVVGGVDEAIDHIARYGSQHTDTIVTENYTNGRRFLREVDSSSVMINASPRFADGFEYGLGAEIGISTNKLHARGPVGLTGLTTQKFIVFGDGQIRQ